MKRFFLPILALFLFLVCSQSKAEVFWQNDVYQFWYYSENLASFYYLAEQYYRAYNQQVTRNESLAQYCSVAEAKINEFENIPLPGSNIDLEVMAKGPDCNANHQSTIPNGIMVQASLGTIANLLDEHQGVEIAQEATTWFTRRFEVDQEDIYKVRADLITGTIAFDSFTTSEVYQAYYLISAEVTLHQIVGTGDQISIISMPGFPVFLDETNRSATIDVQLEPFNDQFQKITYQIKSQLKLKSRIRNFEQKTFFVEGDVNGTYQLGTGEAPLKLQAVVYQGNYVDSDQDGWSDDLDNCPDSYNPDQVDNDEDGFGDVCDACPADPAKTDPDLCGCGVADTDSDGDGTADCNDACPADPAKIQPGVCGCGVADTDSDGDGTADCNDACPADPAKIQPGICGCGIPDTDNDGDRMVDCWEEDYGLNTSADDAIEDLDEDGFTNIIEYRRNTNPSDPNSHPSKVTPWIPLLLFDD